VHLHPIPRASSLTWKLASLQTHIEHQPCLVASHFQFFPATAMAELSKLAATTTQTTAHPSPRRVHRWPWPAALKPRRSTPAIGDHNCWPKPAGPTPSPALPVFVCCSIHKWDLEGGSFGAKEGKCRGLYANLYETWIVKRLIIDFKKKLGFLDHLCLLASCLIQRWIKSI
jgi:hypothetical protein